MPHGSSSYQSISAAGPQQQTRAPPPLLLSIDGTDGRTDTQPFYDAYRILCGTRKKLLIALHVPLTHTHTHPVQRPFVRDYPGSTRKEKSIWILLKQETVSGCGISWAICKSAPRSRQITTPAEMTMGHTF